MFNMRSSENVCWLRLWVAWISRFMTVCSCVLISHHINHFNLCQHRIFRSQDYVLCTPGSKTQNCFLKLGKCHIFQDLLHTQEPLKHWIKGKKQKSVIGFQMHSITFVYYSYQPICVASWFTNHLIPRLSLSSLFF